MFTMLETPAGGTTYIDPTKVVAVTQVAERSAIAPDAPPRVIEGAAAVWMHGCPAPMIVKGHQSAVAHALAMARRVDEDDISARAANAMRSGLSIATPTHIPAPSPCASTKRAALETAAECGCPECAAWRTEQAAVAALDEFLGGGPLGSGPLQ